METPLSVPSYEHLREVLDSSSVLNPLATGARDLLMRMVDDVLHLMPEVHHFHLGGDEAWSMGEHPDTKAYIEAYGKDALYLQHVEPLLDHLNAQGIRPILWHDMMIHWDSAALTTLAEKSDLLTWGYSGHPDTTQHHFNTKYINRFHEHGITLWGGTAYKGADGHNSDLPNLARRQENALAWMEVAQRFEYTGGVATAWSRYSTNRVQCEPIDAALDSLINIGVILHDGQPPEGGIDSCIAALADLGERQTFEACHTAMEQLSAIRVAGWRQVQILREQMALCTRESRRTSSGLLRKGMAQLEATLAQAKGVEQEVLSSFAGLVEPVWLEEYVHTRLSPLEDELSELQMKL